MLQQVKKTVAGAVSIPQMNTITTENSKAPCLCMVTHSYMTWVWSWLIVVLQPFTLYVLHPLEPQLFL